MGTLEKFLNKIKSVVKKDEIEDTIGNLRDVLQHTINQTSLAAQAFDRKAASNGDFGKLLRILERQLKNDMRSLSGMAYDNNLFSSINKLLKALQVNLASIDEYVDKEVGEVTLTEGIGLKRLTYLAAIDKAWFVVDYTWTLIDYYIDQATQSEEPMVLKDQVNLLFRSAPGFSSTACVLGSTPKKFEGYFKQLPEVELKGRDPSLLANQYDVISKTNLLGFSWSPIFFFQKMAGDYEVQKYRERKDKIQYLSLRLVYLENERRRVDDPALEREIEYLKSRIERLEAKNQEFEEKVREG